MQHTFNDDRTCVDADAPLVTDTPVVAGPLWEQSKWQQAAAMYCIKYWSQTLSANFDRANANAATRVGAVAAETANAAFDSCPNLPGVDELGHLYAWDVCYMAFGHLSETQIAAMHKVAFESNPVQYKWAQYYAANPPASYTPISLAVPSPSPSPSSSAAPSPKPSPSPSPSPSSSGSSTSGGCRSSSEGGCPCKASWDFNSATYKDCASGVPGAEARNSWCAVDTSSGNCGGTLRAGWWAYCTPSCGSSTSTTTSMPSPSPSPAPSSASTPSGTPDCGAGALTRRGYNCTASRWLLPTDPSATKYSGCANPNNDVNGAWCPIVKAQQAGGVTWDYCQVGCPGGAAAAASTSAALPKKKCGSGYTGLPAGCSCAASYDIKFDGYSTSYTGMSGCTAYDETGGEGACVLTGCSRAVNNGKTQACGCS
ncbi:hypothetical protein HYH02_007032 [Chlamydomonas schloesseri]|uniref:Uncharacterized protein n=1 Tax=Chlamydomonas schloesseri TaxID=2026947 RepID=A0A835WI24_9CHLO|nr:hypothetical protein HYH02_007032 [Chlamydomonas schloesseri]|eukprot:KAG2448004.1 hypothetical protein HYH02_007032 [Chlamydomonas schloesseri]